VEPSPLLLRPLVAYRTSPGWWWMMMSVEQSMEWVGEETEALEEILPQYRFVHHKSHMTWPGLEPGKPATNRLSYGTASVGSLTSITASVVMFREFVFCIALYLYWCKVCVVCFALHLYWCKASVVCIALHLYWCKACGFCIALHLYWCNGVLCLYCFELVMV
jgi:hypothetical protein